MNPLKVLSVNSLKALHFVGIGGIGLSRLAKYFYHTGKQVSGSDIEKSEITEELAKLGIKIFHSHKKDNLPEKFDLLVYSEAIPENNPERQAAKSKNISEISHFNLLGLISQHHETIAVAGTNGKSSTTAMIGLILEKAGLDPTVFLGSKMDSWNGNLRVGKSNLFVIEADELNRQFLGLYPNTAVLTNIEMDHLDYYKDLNDIKSAFSEFIKKVSDQGKIIYNGDDRVSREVMEHIHHPNEINYGKNSKNVKLIKSMASQKLQEFVVQFQGEKKSEKFELQVPGNFNIYNALAAIAVAKVYNVPMKSVYESLRQYKGIWRRFEILGGVGNTVVVSDYAHHPTSITATVKAAREFYKNKKILLVFQPHQRERTKFLFQELISSLVQANADKLILTDIFDVPGREKDKEDIKGIDFFEGVSKRIPTAEYQPNSQALLNSIRGQLSSYDVVIVMGAGDVFRVADELIK